MPVSRIHPVRHMSLKYNILAFCCISIFLIPKLIFGFKCTISFWNVNISSAKNLLATVFMGGGMWKTLPGIKYEISVVCINKDLWMHARKTFLSNEINKKPTTVNRCYCQNPWAGRYRLPILSKMEPSCSAVRKWR